MGAEFCFAELKAKDDVSATKEGTALIEQATLDHGRSGYTGSFAECDGVRVEGDESLDDAVAAEAWLDENAEKWGPMLIVKVKDGSYCAGAWCSS